ncbi:hypothetical protein CSKR_105722 [Clonorchis sinensis]|uniref:Uncharacterized protein n=1 Tax=Clonorchis sinensis TaxID=79923 RepID=A0A419QGZ6_CLOSI|nr:hypothetical protein CSKR_105722 [Clonorchis sinensis]
MALVPSFLNLEDHSLQTIGQGSKTLICISFTKLNIHLLLECVFLNFSEYSLTVTQMQANATKRLHKVRNRSHFSRDAKRIYEKSCYSHASSVVSTVTLVAPKPTLQTIGQGSKTLICISFTKLNIHLLLECVFLNFSEYSLTVTQMQANATKRLHKVRNRSHFSRDAKRIYEKSCYSHASSVVSTVTLVAPKPTVCLKPLEHWPTLDQQDQWWYESRNS